MKKVGIFTVLVFAFSLFLSGAALAGGMSEAEKGKTQAAATKGEIVGLAVIDQEGGSIGTVAGIETDAEGVIRFVTLGVGEKEYFVPFAAFSPAEETDALVLTVDERLLVSAPAKTPAMTEEEFNRELYEHYGLAPYWGSGSEAAPGK